MRKKKIKLWSPHRYLVAAIRKTWRWSPERRSALKKAQVRPHWWTCAVCAKEFTKIPFTFKSGRTRIQMDGAVDHIKPIGKQPKTFDEYPEYLKKHFCGEANLQVLCKACHLLKSNVEKGTK